MVSEAILTVLVCPNCSHRLDVDRDQAVCAACKTSYHPNRQRQLDLRLRSPKRYQLEFTVGPELSESSLQQIDSIPVNPNPDFDHQTIPIPAELGRGNRLTPELLSYFPRANPGDLVLDLGCGGEPFREICSQLGYEYVGIDYDGDAPMLADAHAMPFKDESFAFVISFAVLEHLRNPHVALREVLRVMKPGALFIGTVAFLEPFHLRSYFHPSPLGTRELLSSSGFEICHLEPNSNWQGLQALAEMSLFPHAPRLLADLFVLPVHLLHRLWWKLGGAVQRRAETSEHARRITNAGGFRFVCRKPSASETHALDFETGG